MSKYKSYSEQYPDITKEKPYSASTIASSSTELPLTYSDLIAMTNTGESLDERFVSGILVIEGDQDKPEKGYLGYLYVQKISGTDKADAYIWANDTTGYVQISGADVTNTGTDLHFNALSSGTYDITLSENSYISVASVPATAVNATLYIYNSSDSSINVDIPSTLAEKTCRKSIGTFDIKSKCVTVVDIRYAPGIADGIFIVNVGSNCF